MNKLTLEAAAGVYSGTAHDTGPYPTNIERNKAFKAGAEWQRNHVWHSNTEMPSDGMAENGDGKMCLVVKNKELFVSRAHLSRAGNYYFCDEGIWRPIDSITAWAYLDDILPTSFDEILEANKDVLQQSKDE